LLNFQSGLLTKRVESRMSDQALLGIGPHNPTFDDMSSTKVPLHDKSRIVSLMGIGRDITARKQCRFPLIGSDYRLVQSIHLIALGRRETMISSTTSQQGMQIRETLAAEFDRDPQAGSKLEQV
jgi:hypothetical protein